MTVTVIIIGYNQSNKLTSTETASTLILERGPCSPDCSIGRAVVVVPPRTAGAPYTLAYDNASNAKPAETYVLKFDDETDAKSWLEALPPEQLMGKTVLLIGDALSP